MALLRVPYVSLLTALASRFALGIMLGPRHSRQLRRCMSASHLHASASCMFYFVATELEVSLVVAVLSTSSYHVHGLVMSSLLRCRGARLACRRSHTFVRGQGLSASCDVVPSQIWELIDLIWAFVADFTNS